jgi:hypothetical protein
MGWGLRPQQLQEMRWGLRHQLQVMGWGLPR